MIGTIVLFIVSALLLYLWSKRRPNNFPPGPTPLPIIGNIHQMPRGHFWIAVDKWSKKYGPIIGLSAFNSLIVAITEIDHIVAALRKEEFQARPDSVVTRERMFGKVLGIFFSSGEQWSSSRKFTVKQMRAFGKNEKENLIADEISRLMETIKDGTIIRGDGLFGLAAINVIWMIVASKRIDFNDKRSKQFLENLHELFRQGSSSGEIEDMFPIFRFVSRKFKHNQALTYGIYGFIQETIQEHKEILDSNNPKDLIDNYLIEIERNKNSHPSYFSEEDLTVVANDLFSAGAESTSYSCEFVLLYMILYPEVQRKMQEEIDRVLGRSRKPLLEDKVQMHYTMAVLNEVERINSVAPASVPHSCSKDTTFGGYFIPKGTILLLNLRSVGYDPKYWKTPEEFIPERFLNADGQYTKPSNMPTFGLGQRTCVGEVLARNIIFLFTTTFFEKFSISLPPGEPEPSTMALPGITTAPRPFKISIKSRY
uniref:Cytochrome P450 n=1 Tax=Cuerna arida TaxID=1464854 RepID=A0A1B6FWU3_9HEMI